jgi:hypothetical protein
MKQDSKTQDIDAQEQKRFLIRQAYQKELNAALRGRIF